MNIIMPIGKPLTSVDYNKVCEGKGEWIGIFPKDSRTHTRWVCDACGLCFKATYHNIQQGRWCRDCSYRKRADKQRFTNEDYNKICEGKGEWIGILPKDCDACTRWVCDMCGLCFEMRYRSVQQGQWCGDCANRKHADEQRSTNEDYNKICEGKGEWIGILPKNSNICTRWVCDACGLCFEMRYRGIQQGQWCPPCSKSRSEKLVRAYFEIKFNKAFPSCRPKWLINDTNCLLELDGYCEELNIAFEYNGIQHYEMIYRYESESKLEDQKQRDFVKYELCSIFGIQLCVIPYWYNCYDEPKLYRFIDDWIRENIK